MSIHIILLRILHFNFRNFCTSHSDNNAKFFNWLSANSLFKDPVRIETKVSGLMQHMQGFETSEMRNPSKRAFRFACLMHSN